MPHIGVDDVCIRLLKCLSCTDCFVPLLLVDALHALTQKLLSSRIRIDEYLLTFF